VRLSSSGGWCSVVIVAPGVGTAGGGPTVVNEPVNQV
jgi:hypothetical protein